MLPEFRRLPKVIVEERKRLSVTDSEHRSVDQKAKILAVRRLYDFLIATFWSGKALVGPDPGARFNLRIWRFIKSYLPFLPWSDRYMFMQAQAYWVLANQQMYRQFGDEVFADVGHACAHEILNNQMPEGFWEYPIPEWSGRIGTIEGNWAAIGMLASYEVAPDDQLLQGALKWFAFLMKQIGFQSSHSGLAINYFANRQVGVVPNATSLTLALFGKLFAVTGDDEYLKNSSEMISFLRSVQEKSGEFPYILESPTGKGRPHYQCYQYQAFQLLDLAMYFETTADAQVLPLIAGLAEFLHKGIKPDGRTQFDCADKGVDVIYHTAAVAAALKTAFDQGFINNRDDEFSAYDYVLSQQHASGAFLFSKGDYAVLRDTRPYPRYLAMILHHLLLGIQPAQTSIGEPL